MVSDVGGGIGDDPFWHWLIGVYRTFERRLRADGGDGSDASFALGDLLRELQAVLTRDNFTAVTRLTEDSGPRRDQRPDQTDSSGRGTCHPCM